MILNFFFEYKCKFSFNLSTKHLSRRAISAMTLSNFRSQIQIITRQHNLHRSNSNHSCYLLFVTQCVVAISVEVQYDVLAISIWKLSNSIFPTYLKYCVYLRKVFNSVQDICLLPRRLIRQNAAYGSKSWTRASLCRCCSICNSRTAIFCK